MTSLVTSAPLATAECVKPEAIPPSETPSAPTGELIMNGDPTPYQSRTPRHSHNTSAVGPLLLRSPSAQERPPRRRNPATHPTQESGDPSCYLTRQQIGGSRLDASKEAMRTEHGFPKRTLSVTRPGGGGICNKGDRDTPKRSLSIHMPPTDKSYCRKAAP